MAHVTRDHHQLVVEGRGCDEQIKIANDQSSAAQLATHAGEALHNPAVQWQYLDAAQKSHEDLLTRAGITSPVDPLINFAIGDEADRKIASP